MSNNSTNAIIHHEHCKDIRNILIIEDSLSLVRTLKESIIDKLGIVSDIATHEVQAKELMEKTPYDLAIVDLNLPDSSGNFIGYLIRKKMGVIIITASNNDDVRKKLTSLPIIDYLYKTDKNSIVNYVIKSIQRLQKNKDAIVGICDDSKLIRRQIGQLLSHQNIQYVEFENEKVANEYIKEKKTIDLLITDINTPKMSGLDLIRKIRQEYSAEKLPILSFSSSGNPILVAQILKSGANDYLSKPTNNEEFLTRLNISLDNSRLHSANEELILKLQESSVKDFLTTLHNRNYFHSVVKQIQSQAQRENTNYGIIMIDIDFFKKVNDNYGHDVGDATIKEISNILKRSARNSDVVCRWGGEEFLILVPNTSMQELSNFANRIRKLVEQRDISTKDGLISFKVTISLGVALSNKTNVSNAENIINEADDRLYRAKNSGRNKVVYE